jgi:20S proteasome subunit beta 4
MSDSLIGLVGADFVLLAADTATTRSVLKMKLDDDKIMELESHKLLGAVGPVGDRVHFTEYVQRNLKLYKFRNNLTLGMHATANFVRGELATALRSSPYQVNLLLGGVDADGPSLYFLDYLASMDKLEYAAHGYCAYFCLSILDKYYKKDLTLEEGIDIIGKCITELRARFVINSPDFIIKVVDKNGTRIVKGPTTTDEAKEKGKERA